MATQDLSEVPREAVDRSQRGGSIGMVLLVAIVLVGAAVALLFIGRTRAEPYIIGLLAVLAVIGVFSLFAIAAGILRMPGKEVNPLIKAVTDTANDGLVVTDPAGRVVYANATYLNLVNAVDANDVRPVERVFVGDPDVSEAVYRLAKAARESRRLQEEVRVPGLRGAPARWLRLRVRPLGTNGREARCTVWTVADVTRDRERQENVFQELQHAIDYLDHAPAGFFSIDAAGKVTYVNATLAGWLDHDLAEVGSGGLTVNEIVAGDGAALLTSLSAAPGEVKTEVFDLDLKTRGGKTVPVRLYHKVAFSADGTPGVSRTLVLNRAREENADALRAAEVRFVRFFHNAPMAITTVDKAGKIVRTNAPFARLFHGVLKGDAVPAEGRSVLSVVADRDRGALEAAIAKAADGQGDIAPVDAALSGEGNRSASFYVSAVEADERDGEAAIVYAIERTEQRALEAQFAQSQKMQAVGQLAGGIAHDFNNVLSAIMMATDFLLNAHRPTDPSFQDIMHIKQNANRAASLVRQLLAFSRKQTLRPQLIELSETLPDLSMLLRRLIGEKVTLDIPLIRDLWQIRADVGQFEQAIINLAVNARDAMPGGGKLTIRTSNVSAEESVRLQRKGMPAGEYVEIEVVDTGTGIAPNVIDKIFDPFYTTKDIGKGTGLGLATVYGFIKQTGGFIYVDSELDKGTTFRIFIPRYVPVNDDARQPPEVASPRLAGPMPPADDKKRATTD